MTESHKPSSASEKVRIENEGGFITDSDGILRVNGELGVSRAMGNSGSRPLISTEADSCWIGSDQFTKIKKIILITDGVTDVMDSDLLLKTASENNLAKGFS
jgi:serine/threonine protein phosphatase PrpC